MNDLLVKPEKHNDLDIFITVHYVPAQSLKI